jgi:protein-tyrosine phosphatase
MAEGMARDMLERVGSEMTVSSAGIVGWDGSGATREAVEAARERGFDISRHRARRLERSHVESADLVVCMTTEQLDAVNRMAPAVGARTFTLKELVRLLEELPPRGPDTEFEERVRQADELRRSGFEGSPYDLDVADPIGMGLEIYRASAWDIDEWCTRLVTGLFGEIPAREEAV